MTENIETLQHESCTAGYLTADGWQKYDCNVGFSTAVSCPPKTLAEKIQPIASELASVTIVFMLCTTYLVGKFRRKGILG
jgi:hypothetical protein